MQIQRTRLGPLVKLGTGAQGTVYRPQPDLAGKIRVDGALVVKLYHAALAPDVSRELVRRAVWARSLDADELRLLLRCVSWPLAVVNDATGASGIVMRDMTSVYGVSARAHSGATKSALLTLGWLIEPEGFLQDRGMSIRLDTEARLQWARCFARRLFVLHQREIVVGDFSMANVLGRPEGKFHAAFIDADSMTFQGRDGVVVTGTPDWDLPAEWHEASGTKSSDSYKMGLAILRLFARLQLVRDIREHRRDVPLELRPLIVRATDQNQDARPTALEWVEALDSVSLDGLNARYPGPAAGQTTRRARPNTPAPSPNASAPTAGPQATHVRPQPAAPTPIALAPPAPIRIAARAISPTLPTAVTPALTTSRFQPTVVPPKPPVAPFQPPPAPPRPVVAPLRHVPPPPGPNLARPEPRRDADSGGRLALAGFVASGRLVSRLPLVALVVLGEAVYAGSYTFSPVPGAPQGFASGLKWCGACALLALSVVFTFEVLFGPVAPRRRSTGKKVIAASGALGAAVWAASLRDRDPTPLGWMALALFVALGACIAVAWLGDRRRWSVVRVIAAATAIAAAGVCAGAVVGPRAAQPWMSQNVVSARLTSGVSYLLGRLQLRSFGLLPGTPVPVRRSPREASHVVAMLPAGAQVLVTCTRSGDAVRRSVHQARTRVWDRIADPAGFVSDSYVDTGTTGRAAPAC